MDLLGKINGKKGMEVSEELALAAPKFVTADVSDDSWKSKLTRKQTTSVTSHFTSALPGSHVEEMVFQELSKLGITQSNTVFAQSSCPDELNHDDYAEDITNLMQHRWGEVFPLGGLAGLPFTGKTGWGAFSHHVPVDGNIVVLYAPHVGLTE